MALFDFQKHWLEYQLLKGVILLSYQKPILQLLISVFFYLGLKEINGLLTRSEVKMTGYWPMFMDGEDVEVHKQAKKERGLYPTILTEQAWSIKDLLNEIKHQTIIFVLVYLKGLKWKLVACKKKINDKCTFILIGRMQK